jgi:glycosyltransferase involved in cell wall biosynthesis
MDRRDAPRVSIVLPARNAAGSIDEALASVLAQTFEDFECIVVDDGSDDETAERVRGWSDPRIRLVSQPPKGLVAALRRGVDFAEAPYIARLDADDAWEDRTKLQQQVEHLDRSGECVVVGTWFRLVHPDGSSMVVRPPSEDGELRRRLLGDATLAHPAVVFRKSVYEAVGGYRSRFDLAEDADLWFRMGRRGTFYVLPLVGLRYAVGGGGRSEAQAWRQCAASLALVLANLPHIRAYPGLPQTVATLLRRLVVLSVLRVRDITR